MFSVFIEITSEASVLMEKKNYYTCRSPEVWKSESVTAINNTVFTTMNYTIFKLTWASS